MDFSYNFITIIQDVFLRLDWESSVVFFWFSLINELFAVLPYVVLVSGQVVFLDSALSFGTFSKLFLFIALPAGVGGAIGSLLIYGLAYFGGKPTINKFQNYLHFSWDDVEKVMSRFKGAWYDDLLFILIRSMPVLPSLPINIAAGVLRMHPVIYFIYTAIGFIIRLIILFIFMAIGSSLLFY